MQMVILAGGLGMRLRLLTERVPKCLIPVNGRPFLEYQLEMLGQRGVRDIVLCVGYLGEAVLDHFGAGLAVRAQTRAAETFGNQPVLLSFPAFIFVE